jgi:hypothetical protein
MNVHKYVTDIYIKNLIASIGKKDNRHRSLTCTLRLIKSRRIIWTGHVELMVEMIKAYKILVGIPDGRDHSEDLDVDVRIILEWIFGK